MDETLHTPFSKVYDNFLSRVTDDMYMELTELDTFQMLEELLVAAIPKFEFPKICLDYETEAFYDESTYQGVESDYVEVVAYLYSDGYFIHILTPEEINIIATYMIVEWFGYQLASVENTRMKYSGSDYKFTSQANHMQKLLALKKDYEREGFHLQRLYKRRTRDENGILRSTLDIIMKPVKKTSSSNSGTSCCPDNCCKEVLEKAIEHCDTNTEITKDYVDSSFSWKDFPSGG
ncbi:MAG: hypothetical protein LUC37_02860 [Prevotella sp.]|nr:hypothetical protein [Prevotella sp.]